MLQRLSRVFSTWPRSFKMFLCWCVDAGAGAVRHVCGLSSVMLGCFAGAWCVEVAPLSSLSGQQPGPWIYKLFSLCRLQPIALTCFFRSVLLTRMLETHLSQIQASCSRSFLVFRYAQQFLGFSFRCIFRFFLIFRYFSVGQFRIL